MPLIAMTISSNAVMLSHYPAQLCPDNVNNDDDNNKNTNNDNYASSTARSKQKS